MTRCNFSSLDEIKVEISPGKAVSLVGNAIEFQCSVKPGATYNWVHNGKKVNGDKRQSKYVTTTRGYLKINNISLEDQGQVTCLAQNKAGLSAASGNLVIGSFPRIVNYPNEVVTVERPQKSLVLPCKADGIPRPKITWLKDGVQIASDHERLFSSDGSLIILRMRMHYQGIYTCFASNQLGKVSVRTRVYLGQGIEFDCFAIIRQSLSNRPANQQRFRELEIKSKTSMCLPSCRRDSGFCVVKHVCECLPEFQGPACELRRNTVAVEHKPIVNNTVNGKPALAPDPTSWVYETYNIDINQGSGSHGVTDGDDSDASDGDMIVDVERSGVGTNVYKPDKNEETKKADRIVIKQKGAAHVKPSKYHRQSHVVEQTTRKKIKQNQETSKATQLSLTSARLSRTAIKVPLPFVRISRSPKLKKLKMELEVIGVDPVVETDTAVRTLKTHAIRRPIAISNYGSAVKQAGGKGTYA
eukprot:gene10296-11357_t